MKPKSRVRAIVCAGSFVVLFAFGELTAHGQGRFPKAEIFAGASLLCSGCSEQGRQLFGGWQAGVTGNLRQDFGIAGDFGGHYRRVSGVGLSQYEYLVGPRFIVRGPRVTGFVHALFGGVTLHGSGFTTTAFAVGTGGGVDVNVNRKWGIRIFQFDYIPSRFSSFQFWSHDLRLGIGFVIKAGS